MLESPAAIPCISTTLKHSGVREVAHGSAVHSTAYSTVWYNITVQILVFQ